MGDFPESEMYRERLTRWTGTGRTLANLPKYNRDLIRKLDNCLATDIPRILRPLAMEDPGMMAELERPRDAQAFSPAFLQGAEGEEAKAFQALALGAIRSAHNDDDDDGPGGQAGAGVGAVGGGLAGGGFGGASKNDPSGSGFDLLAAGQPTSFKQVCARACLRTKRTPVVARESGLRGM